jgi:hypothetical protein
VDLPKHPVVGGHPVHAMLSDGPVILIPLAVAAEVLERAGLAGDRRAADLLTGSAAAASLAAATVGWIDWLTIPASHPARRPATIHGLINSAAAIAVAAALPARRQRLGLLSAAVATVVVGAWIRRRPRLPLRFGGFGPPRSRDRTRSDRRIRRRPRRSRRPVERSPRFEREKTFLASRLTSIPPHRRGIVVIDHRDPPRARDGAATTPRGRSRSLAVTEEILGQFLGDDSFPVTWESEAEKDLFWVYDDLHIPHPVSPMFLRHRRLVALLRPHVPAVRHAVRRSTGSPRTSTATCTRRRSRRPGLRIEGTEYSSRYRRAVPRDGAFAATMGAYLDTVLPVYGEHFAGLVARPARARDGAQLRVSRGRARRADG